MTWCTGRPDSLFWIFGTHSNQPVQFWRERGLKAPCVDGLWQTPPFLPPFPYHPNDVIAVWCHSRLMSQLSDVMSVWYHSCLMSLLSDDVIAVCWKFIEISTMFLLSHLKMPREKRKPCLRSEHPSTTLGWFYKDLAKHLRMLLPCFRRERRAHR